MATKNENDSSKKEEQVVGEAEVDEAAVDAMKEQYKHRLYQMIKDAESMGITLRDMYSIPPSATTLGPALPASEDERRVPGLAKNPGSINTPWWEWERRDVEAQEKVTFTPAPIPTMIWPIPDEYGRYKIKLDINNLVCWLTVGEPNTVAQMFYEGYKDGENAYLQLNRLRKEGMPNMAWGNKPGTWLYNPNPLSFGLDINGKAHQIGSPTTLDNVLKYLAENAKTEE